MLIESALMKFLRESSNHFSFDVAEPAIIDDVIAVRLLYFSFPAALAVRENSIKLKRSKPYGYPPRVTSTFARLSRANGKMSHTCLQSSQEGIRDRDKVLNYFFAPLELGLRSNEREFSPRRNSVCETFLIMLMMMTMANLN